MLLRLLLPRAVRGTGTHAQGSLGNPRTQLMPCGKIPLAWLRSAPRDAQQEEQEQPEQGKQG